jgi:Tfp pilus assembly protein PilF
VLNRTNKLLREVVDSPTARPADYAELGELLLGMKQEGRGVYWLYQALERDPQNQQAHRALAVYYERKGQAEKAATHRRAVRRAEASAGRAAAEGWQP